jgi:hypothetical protein
MEIFRILHNLCIVSAVNWGSYTGETDGLVDMPVKEQRTHRKGKHLNTLEKYYIYKVSKDNLQMNDTNNPIFKTLQETNTR